MVDLLSTSMFSTQILKTTKTARENIKVAKKGSCLSPEEAPNYGRLAATIRLRAMSKIMIASWCFATGTDESNDKGGDPHLDS